jgi:tRNA (cytidine/uridine-2'-O-)-methyltransferase
VHIVLVEPEIPQNTGNIARLCAGTGCKLHLIKPLGFSTDDRYLKRAGLDYWHLVEIYYHDSFRELAEQYADHRFYFNTTKANQRHTDITYTPDDFIVFGKETKGLPEELLAQYPDNLVRIPMIADARSLNLSNAVAVVVYEALRQFNFAGLK